MTDPTSSVYNQDPVPPPPNNHDDEDKNWFFAVGIILVCLLLAGLLLYWVWDTFRDGTKEPEPNPTPTVSESAAPANPTFVVAFDSGDASLDEQDQAVIANAEEEFTKGKDVHAFLIIGRADGTGDPEHNQKLAQARADVVKNDIVADGYTDAKFTVQTELAPTGSPAEQHYRSTDIVIQ